MFVRQRGSGLWLPDTTVLQTELEGLDGNLAKAIDGDGGGAYSPTSAIVIGGAGLDVSSRFTAPGLSDIPMRGAFAPLDTGQAASSSTTTAAMVWCPFDNYPQWVLMHNDVSVHSFDEALFTTGAPAVSPTVGWQAMAANTSRVVGITSNGVANYADEAVSMTWSACTGAVASGSWIALVWDGSKFVAANDSGQFAYSSLGASWSATVNGNPNWLGGPNVANQLAVGKGPSLAARIYCVASSGNTAYFAYSEDSGATWGEINTGFAETWRGIAYRESDHTWLASTNDGKIYTSVDGGATWGLAATLTWGSSAAWILSYPMRIINDMFVTVGTSFATRLLYSKDCVNWYRGTHTSRTGYTTHALAVGNGGLAWAQVKTSSNIILRFSQKSSSDQEAA